jgi:hypothetical protein
MKVVISEDAERVAELRKSLKENNGYCPCEFEKTEDTKCMCKTFREQQTEGYCHCGLYKKVKK